MNKIWTKVKKNIQPLWAGLEHNFSRTWSQLVLFDMFRIHWPKNQIDKEMYLLAPVVQHRGLFCGTAVPGTKKIADQQIPGTWVPGTYKIVDQEMARTW